MGHVKQFLIDAECNGHIHPVILQALRAFQPTPAPTSAANPFNPTTIYGLYANGVLLATYLHKDTAEYELWLSRMGEEVTNPETPTEYTVSPLPMHTHTADQI